MTAVERRIDTPHGEARLVVRRARGAVATLLLSHGAGGGHRGPRPQALGDDLPRNGVTVVLLEQPWRLAGRKVATPPATLDAGLVAAANRLKTRTPLVVGGRSAGARSAARCARQLGAVGLPGAGLPAAPAGQAGEVAARRAARRPGADAGDPGRARHLRPARGVPRPTSTWPSCPAADHGFKVPARGELTEADAMGIIVESTLEWIVREVAGGGARRE